MLNEDTVEVPALGARGRLSGYVAGAALRSGADDLGPLHEIEARRAVRPGFLSEREAAEFLGMSTEELVGLRKLDLAMIAKGFKPHGPPPLWQGRVCTYSAENLDAWVRSQWAITPGRD